MKKIFFLSLVLLLSSQIGFTQIINSGGAIDIDSSAILHSDVEIKNTNSGNIHNHGTLHTENNLTNEANSNLDGNGQYIIGRDWNNFGNYTAGTSIVDFQGDSTSLVNSGNAAFYKVTLSKTDANISLADMMRISNEITFINNDNKIILGTNDLQLSASATILNFDNDNYIVTNDIGQLKKSDLGETAFTFPVGHDVDSYNPVILVQTDQGTVDTFGVRCEANVLEMGTSGTPIASGVVDASWEITEVTPGGSDLQLTLQWEENR